MFSTAILVLSLVILSIAAPQAPKYSKATRRGYQYHSTSSSDASAAGASSSATSSASYQGGGSDAYSPWAQSHMSDVNQLEERLRQEYNSQVVGDYTGGQSSGFYRSILGSNNFGKPNFSDKTQEELDQLAKEMTQKMMADMRDGKLEFNQISEPEWFKHQAAQGLEAAVLQRQKCKICSPSVLGGNSGTRTSEQQQYEITSNNNNNNFVVQQIPSYGSNLEQLSKSERHETKYQPGSLTVIGGGNQLISSQKDCTSSASTSGASVYPIVVGQNQNTLEKLSETVSKTNIDAAVPVYPGSYFSKQEYESFQKHQQPVQHILVPGSSRSEHATTNHRYEQHRNPGYQVVIPGANRVTSERREEHHQSSQQRPVAVLVGSNAKTDEKHFESHSQSTNRQPLIIATTAGQTEYQRRLEEEQHRQSQQNLIFPEFTITTHDQQENIEQSHRQPVNLVVIPNAGKTEQTTIVQNTTSNRYPQPIVLNQGGSQREEYYKNEHHVNYQRPQVVQINQGQQSEKIYNRTESHHHQYPQNIYIQGGNNVNREFNRSETQTHHYPAPQIIVQQGPNQKIEKKYESETHTRYPAQQVIVQQGQNERTEQLYDRTESHRVQPQTVVIQQGTGSTQSEYDRVESHHDSRYIPIIAGGSSRTTATVEREEHEKHDYQRPSHGHAGMQTEYEFENNEHHAARPAVIIAGGSSKVVSENVEKHSNTFHRPASIYVQSGGSHYNSSSFRNEEHHRQHPQINVVVGGNSVDEERREQESHHHYQPGTTILLPHERYNETHLVSGSRVIDQYPSWVAGYNQSKFQENQERFEHHQQHPGSLIYVPGFNRSWEFARIEEDRRKHLDFVLQQQRTQHEKTLSELNSSSSGGGLYGFMSAEEQKEEWEREIERRRQYLIYIGALERTSYFNYSLYESYFDDGGLYYIYLSDGGDCNGLCECVACDGLWNQDPNPSPYPYPQTTTPQTSASVFDGRPGCVRRFNMSQLSQDRGDQPPQQFEEDYEAEEELVDCVPEYQREPEESPVEAQRTFAAGGVQNSNGNYYWDNSQSQKRNRRSGKSELDEDLEEGQRTVSFGFESEDNQQSVPIYQRREPIADNSGQHGYGTSRTIGSYSQTAQRNIETEDSGETQQTVSFGFGNVQATGKLKTEDDTQQTVGFGLQSANTRETSSNQGSTNRGRNTEYGSGHTYGSSYQSSTQTSNRPEGAHSSLADGVIGGDITGNSGIDSSDHQSTYQISRGDYSPGTVVGGYGARTSGQDDNHSITRTRPYSPHIPVDTTQRNIHPESRNLEIDDTQQTVNIGQELDSTYSSRGLQHNSGIGSFSQTAQIDVTRNVRVNANDDLQHTHNIDSGYRSATGHHIYQSSDKTQQKETLGGLSGSAQILPVQGSYGIDSQTRNQASASNNPNQVTQQSSVGESIHSSYNNAGSSYGITSSTTVYHGQGRYAGAAREPAADDLGQQQVDVFENQNQQTEDLYQQSQMNWGQELQQQQQINGRYLQTEQLGGGIQSTISHNDATHEIQATIEEITTTTTKPGFWSRVGQKAKDVFG